MRVFAVFNHRREGKKMSMGVMKPVDEVSGWRISQFNPHCNQPVTGVLPEELSFSTGERVREESDYSHQLNKVCAAGEPVLPPAVQVVYFGHVAEINFQTLRYRPDVVELSALLDRQCWAHLISAYRLDSLGAGVFWLYQNPTMINADFKHVVDLVVYVLQSRPQWRA